MRLRWIAWILCTILLTLLYYVYGQYAPEFNAHGRIRAGLGVIAGIIGIGMIFILPKVSLRVSILLILFSSLCVRLAVLPAAASDDVNRYLWEGKLYAQGISPFEEVAAHEIYTEQRDSYWELMNHRDKPTAYPPLSLHSFALINAFSYSPMSYKVAFLLADLFLVALILALLHHYKRPLEWAVIYALSPIPILSFAAEGHFDVLMTLFLVASVFAYSKKWFVICGAAFGIAVAMKIMVVIAAPMLLLRTGFKGMLAATICCLAPFLLHFEDTLQMIHGLVTFGSTNNFNGLFNQFFDDIIGLDSQIANRICGGLFVLSWSLGFWYTIRDRLWLSLMFCLGGLILFAPIMHFWYLTWLLPFIALRPSLPWICYSVTTPLYFLVHAHYIDTGYWELPQWAKWMFHLPFVITSLMLLPSVYRSFFHQLKKDVLLSSETTQGWSVIIPTVSVHSGIIQLIEELGQQEVVPDEVIIVSPEGSEQPQLESEHFKLTSLSAGQGRGAQIKSGVEAASYPWCLVLHAGNTLPKDSFKRINLALERNSHVIGGSLGQRFDQPRLALCFIEALNDFRAGLLKTSFGDQNQFFNRDVALTQAILTDQPLMEDVEMSDRLWQRGETLHLAHESQVSAKKWKRSHFWKRFFSIVKFYLLYRALFFSRVQRANLSKRFYREYYKQAEAK